jgi:osmotically-inducible protein OsmY
MQKTTSISEMQKFHFGSKISCTDGESGTLAYLGFERESHRLQLIGIRLGRFFSKTVFLPLSTVTQASGDGIVLNITSAELEAAERTVPGGALLDSRSAVQRLQSSDAGMLKLVAIEPGSGELRYFVAQDLRPGQAILLYGQYVKELQTNRVLVEISDADLQVLPAYRSDEELQREVESVVFDLTPLHIDSRGMHMRVLDSVLYLDGNISSSLRGDMVRDQAQGVEGLLQIENRLVADDVLAGELALALSRDPRTQGLPIGVYPRLGAVRLSGTARSEEQRRAAVEIARAFPGVHSVTADLRIDSTATMLHVMSPSESGQAQDIIPGKYVRHTK